MGTSLRYFETGVFHLSNLVRLLTVGRPSYETLYSVRVWVTPWTNLTHFRKGPQHTDILNKNKD